MKTTLFDEFIKTNKEVFDDLPDTIGKPIRDKIDIYRELEKRLPDMVGDDKKKAEKKLNDLEQDIYEDLLDVFEDQLTNNEVVEEKQKPAKPKPDKKERDKNEQILSQLKKEGKTENLGRTELKRLGLNVDFSRWEIKVGEHTLKRTEIYTLTFRLV